MLSSIFIFLQDPNILFTHIPAPKTCMPLDLTPICEPRKKNTRKAQPSKPKLSLRTGDNPSTDYTQAACTRHGQGQGKQGLHTEHPRRQWEYITWLQTFGNRPHGNVKPSPHLEESYTKKLGISIPLHCYQNDLGMLMFQDCRVKSDISQQCWTANDKHLKWKHDPEAPVPKNAILQHTLLTTIYQSFKASSQKGQPELNSPFKSGPCPNCAATQDIFKKDAAQQSIRSYCLWFAVLCHCLFYKWQKSADTVTSQRTFTTKKVQLLPSKYFKGLPQQLPPLPTTEE